MPQPVYDVVGGLKYHSGPLQVREYTTDQETFQNSAVRLSATQGIRPWNGVSKVFGVAMHYAAAGEKVLVSIDPETIYEGTAFGPIVQNQIGVFCPLTQENQFVRVGSYSSMRVVGATTTTTPALTHPVQIVGLATNVTNVLPAANNKCLVKLITGELEPYVDAT